MTRRATPPRATLTPDAADAFGKLVVEHAGEVIARHAPDGRIRALTQSAGRLLGYTQDAVDALAADGALMLCHPEDIAPMADACARVRSAGSDGPGERIVHRLRRANGEHLWVETVLRAMPNDGTDATPDVVSVTRDVSETEQLRDTLRAMEARHELAVRGSADGLWEWDIPSGSLVFSPRYRELLGFAENEFPDGSDTFINALHPDDRDRVHAALTAHLSRHEPYNLEFRMRTRAGEWRWFWGRGQAEWAPDGRAVRMAGSNSDITTRKRLEEQLRQSLKMDAVGRLAGGIAHDFNHLLAVIAGNAALALAELPAESVLRSAMQEVARAASRANTLTRQLLAFSHWQAIRPEVVDLDLLLDGIAEPLRRVLGDEAEIVIQPAARKTFVKVDRAQLEEALMHLTANARDAMPSGGAMVLRTEHVEAAGDELGPTPPLSPGSYVRLTVSDTGTGMDETTRLRALEPFFTTKTTGQGAGLGLSTVYGIVRQAGGSVWIDSTMGFGTRIYLYLPAEANSAARAAFAGTSRGRGSETVLLVEDEDAVRSVVLRMLRGQGYAVIEARNGADALEQYERVRGNVDLLVTDLMMPVMGGRDLVVQLRDRVPDLPVIYMSGYAEDARQLVDPRDPLTAVLEKPFTLDSLVRGLGDVLGASGLSNGLNARPAPPA